MQISQNINIPALRQDLKIYPGNYDFDGAPTWMVYDPLSDNYFKIGWFEFECINRFERAQNALELVEIVNTETALTIDMDDVNDLVMFLLNAGLLMANSAQVREILEDGRVDKQTSLLHTLFLKYIFLKVPLFKPQKFLEKTFPFVRFMFTRSFFMGILGLLAFGIFLTVQQWDDFLNTLTAFFSLENIILVMISTIIIKTVHELGHAYMAHKYKVPVTTMGAIFIVFYPILYTETTNAWRIYDRKKRLNIAAAGIMAEMALASMALIVWHISPPGLIQNTAYFIAFISLFLSIFINSNPLMRFDGYYLLSDLLGIDNLQPRAVQFFRWKRRNLSLGTDTEAPEDLPAKKEKFFVLFGTAQTIYMCFLYSGIAFTVYYFVFKPLGFLMALTLLFVFLGMPIIREILYYISERETIVKNKTPKIILGVLTAIIILSFLPLSNTVKVPAVMHYKNYNAFYASNTARVEKIHVINAQFVQKGDMLISLSSEELEQEIKQTQLNLNLYKKVKERQQASRELSVRNVEIDQIIRELETQLSGLNEEQAKLSIKAPFDGKIKDISPTIHLNRWVNKDTLLMRLVNEDTLQVTAYINSEKIGRVEKPASGRFKSDTSLFGSQNLTLSEISSADTKNVIHQELTSIFGGPIPAEKDSNGFAKSKTPLYTLKFSVDSSNQKPELTQKGFVILGVRARSFSGNLLKKLTSLFLRETSI